MALTPEDVVNKRFQPTKFREGYDQDEVDDFLDEVVVELRRLNQENEELRQRLIASDSRINELQRGGGGQLPPVPAQPSFIQQPEPVVAAPVVTPAPAFDASSPLDPSLDAGNTNNLLQLARRVHEAHVREGVEKRDALIAEGHATAARLVAEAEAGQRAQLTLLDQERQNLEGRIDELRNFEREYRQKLKGYIEGQLRELDSASNVLGSASAQHADAQRSEPVQAQHAEPAQQFGEPAQFADAQPQQYSAPAAVQPPASFPGFGSN